MLNHLSMIVFENDEGVHLMMQSYIEIMLTWLGVDVRGGRAARVLMTQPITDMTPRAPTGSVHYSCQHVACVDG